MPSVGKSNYFGVGLQDKRDKHAAPVQNQTCFATLEAKDPFPNGGFTGLKCGKVGHKLEDCDKASKDTSEALFAEEEMVQYCDDIVAQYCSDAPVFQMMGLRMVLRRMKPLLL